MGARFYHVAVAVAILFSGIAKGEMVVQVGSGHFGEPGTRNESGRRDLRSIVEGLRADR